MKKILSVICAAILLTASMSICVQGLESSQINNMETRYNKAQYALYKASNKLKGKSEINIAKEVLKNLGIPENMVNKISEDKLTDIYKSSDIQTSETYSYTDSEGNMFLSNEEEYEQSIIQKEKNVTPYGIVIDGPATEYSWARVSTIAVHHQPDFTQYSYLSLCEWLTKPGWTGKDFHVLFTTEGSITPQSATAVFGCTATGYPAGTEYQEISEYSASSDNFSSGGRIVAFSHNLPTSFVYLGTDGVRYGTSYDKYVSLVMADGKMSDSPYSIPYNVSSTYCHQCFTFGITPTINIGKGAAASFSITPQLVYSNVPNSIEVIHRMSR